MQLCFTTVNAGFDLKLDLKIRQFFRETKAEKRRDDRIMRWAAEQQPSNTRNSSRGVTVDELTRQIRCILCRLLTLSSD